LEPKAATTLNDTRNAVDRNNDFFKFFWRIWRLVSSVIATTTALLLATMLWRA